MIHYVKGDATYPLDVSKNKIIVHCCNDIGAWGAGFVLALSKRWPEPEHAYLTWYELSSRPTLPLGATQFVRVSDDIIVVNLIGQRGLRSSTNRVPVRYDAIQKGLQSIEGAALLPDTTIHMPRMGCGLAGGSWEIIEEILMRLHPDIEVYVYDL